LPSSFPGACGTAGSAATPPPTMSKNDNIKVTRHANWFRLIVIFPSFFTGSTDQQISV
jgi:hypothetical protein